MKSPKEQKPKSKNPEDYIYVFEVDGIISKLNYVNCPEDFLEEGFWESSQTQVPVFNTIQQISRMMQDEEGNGYDVRLLATYFPQAKYTKNERKLWLMTHFRYIEDWRILFCPFGKPKSSLFRYRENVIFISTNKRELEEWEQSGGMAVQAEPDYPANEPIPNSLWYKSTMNFNHAFTAKQILDNALEEKRIAIDEHQQVVSELDKRMEDFSESVTQPIF